MRGEPRSGYPWFEAGRNWLTATRRRLMTAQTLVSAVVLGVLLHLRWSYTAGSADHLVLSPLGLHWYRPDWFAGDWTIANAPQPHWLFDIVTYLGAEMGGPRGVAVLYLLYFLVSLVVFGVATTILARAWAPAHTWSAVLVVTVLGAVTPWWLLGTGSPMLTIALPGVLGGFLVYLTAAALLTGGHRLAAVAAILTALIHVQQGVVVGVLLAVFAVVYSVRRRRVDWLMALSTVVTFLIVVLALRARPVAGHLSDFADACDRLIPYHCNATSWSLPMLGGGLALLALAFFTVAYLPRDQRIRWGIVVVLPAVGLVGGVMVDRFNVPVLGVLAQGLNVYRLDVLLLPLSVWGAVVPLFAALPSAKRRWQVLAAVLVIGFIALRQGGYAVPGTHGGVGMLTFAEGMVVVCAAYNLSWLADRARIIVPIACGVMALNLVAAGITGGTLKLQAFHPGLYPKGNTKIWGDAVQRIVPAGGRIVAPPSEEGIRMATKRAVVADCKYGPYGGEPWKEYSRRIEALGGFKQCAPPGRYQLGYGRLTSDDLVSVAKKYQAGYIVLEGKNNPRRAALSAMGWTLAQGRVGPLEWYLYQAPWVS